MVVVVVVVNDGPRERTNSAQDIKWSFPLPPASIVVVNLYALRLWLHPHHEPIPQNVSGHALVFLPDRNLLGAPGAFLYLRTPRFDDDEGPGSRGFADPSYIP